MKESLYTALMLYLSTTQGVVRVNPDTGEVTRLGPAGTSTESLAVAGEVIVAAVTPDYGLPMRDPLRPGDHPGAIRSADGGQTWQPLQDGLRERGSHLTGPDKTVGAELGVRLPHEMDVAELDGEITTPDR